MRIALALLALFLFPTAANAASVAYVDNGEVWLSSLDGAQKVRLASPVVNGEGKTEDWLAVAASDGGRIVAARNVPGRLASFSWFKVWEPDGTSTVEGPLNAPAGWSIYVYPLGFDITADGAHMVYGFSNSSLNSYGRGFYVRPVTNSPLDPITISGQEDPTLFGSRVISNSGATVNVQDPSSTYQPNFEAWLDTDGTTLEPRRTDVAATGQLAAIELEQWQGGTQTTGVIAVISTNGPGQPLPDPRPVDCTVPAAGVAKEASLSQDARHIAWTDEGGLKVAGTPTTAADPCVLSSAPVVISPTGRSASIGGANMSAFLPPPPIPPTTPPTPPGSAPPPGSGIAGPVATVPAKVKAKALDKLTLKVKVGGAGKVTISATVPAKTLGRKGKPVVVATGSATARRAGTVNVKLRLNATGRAKLKRLKGARLTLKITHGGRSSTKTVKLS